MKNNKGCRILLMTPPKGLWKGSVAKPWIYTQPLGLAYIAATVRNAGFTVEILDAYSLGAHAGGIRQKIDSFEPDIVGVSALTPQWPDAEKLFELVKQAYPRILTIAGGPHVTALPEAVAAHPDIDLAVIGEGEETVREICEAVAGDGDMSRIKGLVNGMNGGQPQSTGPRLRLTDLDSLPFPAHDLLPHPEFYNAFPAWGDGGAFSCMISGRGCPYNCCFCDVTTQQGGRYRLRSARNVIDELELLNRDFGVTTFSFRDPSVICNRDRLMEMCCLIEERRLEIAWTCSARANEIDPEMLAMMKQAGCRLIQYGIEVGNPEMLKRIKRITPDRVAKAVRETRKAGIGAHGYFLFGFLDETPETMQQTIDFAKKLKLDSAGFAVMVPFPGTREFDLYRKESLLLSEDWRDYDVMGDPVYRHKNITKEQLVKARRRAYRQFYLRPRIIAWHIKKLTSKTVLRNYLRSAKLMIE